MSWGLNHKNWFHPKSGHQNSKIKMSARLAIPELWGKNKYRCGLLAVFGVLISVVTCVWCSPYVSMPQFPHCGHCLYCIGGPPCCGWSHPSPSRQQLLFFPNKATLCSSGVPRSMQEFGQDTFQLLIASFTSVWPRTSQWLWLGFSRITGVFQTNAYDTLPCLQVGWYRQRAHLELQFSVCESWPPPGGIAYQIFCLPGYDS